MTKPIKVSRKVVTDALWKRGELSWLLLPHQHVIYEALHEAIIDPERLKYVLSCSRRFGKTSVLVLIAIEHALKGKNRHIRFAAPTAKELKKAIHPIIQIFLATCPKGLKPKFNSVDNSYKFPNGSELHLAGVNNGHEDDLRGANAHLVIVDEAGSIDNLKYLVQSILIPQTLTTDATTLMASTPALSADHDYKQYYDEADFGDYLTELDVYQNSSLTEEKIHQIAEDNGGVESTTFQREYLCKWVTDASLDIIPEWRPDYEKKIERDDLYGFYHKYTCMDIGVKDLTAILYGYYDFRKATLIIEAETTMNGYEMTTQKIYDAIVEKEAELWGQKPTVYKRVADNNNLILLQDLSHMHDMYFIPTLKDSLDAMVNEVRMFVSQGRLIVNPECVQLMGCLRHAIWSGGKSTKRMFARSTTYGHYDALASLVYLIRNLDTAENPIPAGLNINTTDFHINHKMIAEEKSQVKTLKKVYKQ